MGMYVSELRAVPVGLYEYYVYLVDVSGRSAHSAEIGAALHSLAVNSGASALVVSGPQNLSQELFQFLNQHAPKDLDRLENLFHEVSSLIVSEGALQTTTAQVHVLPLIPKNTDTGALQPLLAELVAGLLGAMRGHRVGEYCASLGAERIHLSDLNEGMLVATLRRLNKALELKPNIAGLGVNLNAIIEDALGPATRPLPE